MNAAQLIADLDAGFLVEVIAERCTFAGRVQQFFIYPNDTIVSLVMSEVNEVLVLSHDDEAIFRHRNPEFFQ